MPKMAKHIFLRDTAKKIIDHTPKN